MLPLHPSATEAVEFQSASLEDYVNFAVANLDVVSGATWKPITKQ
jgi:uncharacterized radical SAM superfamily Fe-S cluster-containing enzyme